MENRIIIIDGNSLMNRAFYALKRPMITKEGIHTGALYGFINMLEKLRKDYESGYICVTFDVKAPTFRHKAYKEYKGTRKPMAMELVMQMPLIKDILHAMNIKTIELEGFEADDLIGTISRVGEEQGLKPLVITGDKDALQLADDDVHILYTIKGISTFKIYDDAAFREEYEFAPINLIDYKALVGDKSDNIPGVQGVGKVAATKLLKEYENLGEIYKNIDSIKPDGVRKKLEADIQSAMMSRKLAEINRHVPIEIDFDEYKSEEPNYKELAALYERLEFKSFLKRLDIPEELIEREELAEFEGQIVEEEQINDLMEKIKTVQDVGIKVFTDDNHLKKPMVYGIAFLIEDKIFYVNNTNEEIIKNIFNLLSEKAIKIFGHSLKDDMYGLMSMGIRNFHVGFDTAIGEYVLNPTLNDYTIEELALSVLNVQLDGDAEDVEDEGQQMDLFGAVSKESDDQRRLNEAKKYFPAVVKLMENEKERIAAEGLEKVLEQAELPLIEVMAAMEYEGFAIDVDCLRALGKDISAKVELLTEKIYKEAGREFNIKSPKQLGEVLFDEMGLTAGKKNKSGYATGAEVLEKIKDESPIIPDILEYRKLTKLMSTYIEGLEAFIADDGKIHANFNQTVTATGRISSSNPNMQNIPIKEELGRKIRGAFVPAHPNAVLLGADYSQIELRVLADLSSDEGLLESFNKGQDIHKATAARVLGIPEDQVTPFERSKAKAINFGVIYGMSSFGLSEQLGISIKEADSYIKGYFENHKSVQDYMDGQVEFAREKGYVTTILGRKRYINEIKASNFNVRQQGERLAMNTPVQGSAADIIKLAMILVYDKLKNYKSKLILQIHDELIIQVENDELDEIQQLLKESMENAIQLQVKLSVDMHTGDNWEELK